MRSLGLMWIVVATGCSGQPAGTAVLVTVTGSVPAFDHLAITLSADGTTRTPAPIAQSILPPDIVFAVDVPRSVTGPLHVEVAAQDAGNVTLLGDSGDVPLAPGEIRRLTLTLGAGGDGGPTDDLTSGADLSIPENADLTSGPPDLRPPIPMTVSLAGARPIPANAVGGTRSFVDLNKDGKLDILDATGSNWEVSLNRGDGVFGTMALNSRTGLQPAIDLNNDGLPDFVGFSGNNINVTLNNGLGVYSGTGAVSLAGSVCSTLQIADVNKDTRPDILCYEPGGGGASFDVFLNDGMGAFPPSGSSYPVKGNTLVGLVDVNGDGAPDLLEATGSLNDWHSYFNNGAGLFSPSPSPAGNSFNGMSPTNIQFNDLNGDKRPDGIIRNGTTLEVALNSGDGTFAATTNQALGSSITSLTLTDLNGDGKPDAIVYIATAQIQILLNNGSGVLGAPVTITTAAVGTFQVVDLNNDNKPDIAALEGGGTLDVFLNNGNGTFATRVPYVVNNTGAFQLLDLNKDGFLDLITTTATSFGVLLNNQAGAFGTRHDTTTISQPFFSDLTGDGALEAWGAGGAATSVWYSLNDAAGAFAAPVSSDLANVFTASALASADLNGDGRADVIGGNSYIATTSGVPDLPASVTTSATPTSGVVADVKPDGKPDIVFTISGTQIGAFLNMGGFTFSSEADYAVGTNGYRIAAGHIKSPTSVDVAVANSSTNDVSVLIGNGDGSFQTKVDYPLGTASTALGLADLNHDGYDDLAVGLNTSNVGILLNNGSGIFSPMNPYAGYTTSDLLIADLNGDQRPEIVVANNSASTNQMSVLVNDGTGKFAAKTDYTWLGSVTVTAARLLDLTNDGQLDLVAAISPPATGKLTLRTNNGNGTFAMPTDLVTDGNHFAFGDLNRDGRIDIVTTFGSTLRVMIQDSNGVFQPGAEYLMPTPTTLEIADFDGDGLAEVLCGGSIGTRFHILRNVSR